MERGFGVKVLRYALFSLFTLKFADASKSRPTSFLRSELRAVCDCVSVSVSVELFNRAVHEVNS